MGVIDRIFGKNEKKAEVDLTGHFSEVHKHLGYHKMWINYLHENIRQITQNTDNLHKHHSYHSEEVKRSIDGLNKWVEYLHSSNQKMEKDLTRVEDSIKRQLRKDMEKYHEELLTHIQDLIVTRTDMSQARADILTEMEKRLDERPKRQEIPLKMPVFSSEELTSSEKELVNFLFNQSAPLTYSDIANRMRKSVNSVRVYMNALKLKKDLIEEFRQPNGTKIFGLKNREKVKTLYNLP